MSEETKQVICPICGFDYTQPRPEIPDALKEEFTTAILQGIPFERRLRLGGPGMDVLFREPTVGMITACDHAASLLHGHPQENILRYKLKVLLKTRSLCGKVIDWPGDTLLKCAKGDDVIPVLDAAIAVAVPTDTHMALVASALSAFEALVQVLTQNCLDKNFWKDAGLGA